MVISPDVVFRVLGDEAVLVDLATNQVFELNATAAAAWQRLSQGDAPDAVIAALVARFDVDPGTAHREVHTLLQDLERRGLLRP